jgi:hypothetical protein
VLRRSVEITGAKQPCRRNLETAEFDPSLPFDDQFCRTARHRSRATVW